MMKENEIILIHGTNFREQAIALCEAADLAGMIGDKKKKIGIKPNLVAPVLASEGGTTHPEIAAGVIEYLQKKGFTELVMMEGSWVGDLTEDAYTYCGYAELSERYGVPFVDAQKEEAVKKDCGGLELSITACALSVDFMINLPVLKGHCQTRMTCALKNMKGLLPNREKRHFHAMGLHKPIAHLALGIHQDFILVDNICGDLDFEDGGHPVVMNRMFCGIDPVLIDSFSARELGYETAEIPYIEYAAQLGAGSKDLTTLNLRYLNQPEVSIKDLRPGQRVLEVNDRVEEVESCSACYGYLLPALDMLKEEGLLADLHDKICIGQGYRGKTGKLGVGSCTAKFEHTLKGCPPVETQIYEFLKAYIKGENA